ncbi:MAG: acetyl-CoA synthetase [Oleiphilaceae bacterium]|jgi:acetyl-CoA synthetase
MRLSAGNGGKLPTQPITIPEYFNIGNACTKPSVPKFSMSQTAVIVDQSHQHTQMLSYTELYEQSNRFAHAISHIGLKKSDRVMLWLPNCTSFPVAFFGTLKLGAIAVPTSTLLTSEELDYLLSDSGSRVLVTTHALWQRLLAIGSELSSLAHVILIDDVNMTSPLDTDHPRIQLLNFETFLEQHSTTAIDAQTKANDPAYLVYTSGTTGFPKGVLHAHRALLGRTPSAGYWFKYEKNDRILHSGKFNWTYVLGTALMDPLFLGKTVVVYEGDNNANTWPRLITKYQCTIFIGVPTIYRQIVQKTAFTAKDIPCLKHCMCAGEHLSDDMLSAWKQRFKLSIYEAIGMSECSYYLSQHTGRAIRAGSAGFPQPGHHIALLDKNMQPVEDEQEGMLCIGLDDPGLFIEYWKLPEVTQASRQNNYFLTGDYARRDIDGYFWFLGRKDDIINSFGFRISPHEIERIIKTHPQIADCVAIEETIEKDKNLVVIYVIPKDQQAINTSELITFSAQHLAVYKVPKKVYVVNKFPRTANGKILRKQLLTTM